MQVKKSDEDGNLTAEPLEVDGEPVTAETTFTPETASGEVEVTFTFDSRTIADKREAASHKPLASNHGRREMTPEDVMAKHGVDYFTAQEMLCDGTY